MKSDGDDVSCPICNNRMIELKGGRCLLMCPNCGARFDCSDL